jgi:molybdopterin-guanine dinucleotide biosynthesis protein B
MMRIVAFSGRSGSGKTHLIVRLIEHFSARGQRVSTVKHTHHHDFEIDRPGKDSFRHRAAGAAETLLLSDTGYALLGSGAGDSAAMDAVRRLAPCDLLLVEGFHDWQGIARIEVFRSAFGSRPLAADRSGFTAIAMPADDSCEPVSGVALLDLNDTAGIARFIDELPQQGGRAATQRRGPVIRLAHLHTR